MSLVWSAFWIAFLAIMEWDRKTIRVLYNNNIQSRCSFLKILSSEHTSFSGLWVTHTHSLCRTIPVEIIRDRSKYIYLNTICKTESTESTKSPFSIFSAQLKTFPLKFAAPELHVVFVFSLTRPPSFICRAFVTILKSFNTLPRF